MSESDRMLKDIRKGIIPVPGPIDIVNLIEAIIRDINRIEKEIEYIKRYSNIPKRRTCKIGTFEKGDYY